MEISEEKPHHTL